MMNGVSLFLILFFLASSGCQQQIDPRDTTDPSKPDATDPGKPMDSLENTRWLWDSSWGERSLSFVSGDTVIYIDQAEGTNSESYTYNKSTKKGKIDYYGAFEISKDNQTMHFIEWKNYGHGCDFNLVMEQDSTE